VTEPVDGDIATAGCSPATFQSLNRRTEVVQPTSRLVLAISHYTQRKQVAVVRLSHPIFTQNRLARVSESEWTSWYGVAQKVSHCQELLLNRV